MSGYALGDRLVQSREGRQVIVAESVCRKPCHELEYTATGVKIVIKAFSDATLAAKEAFIFKTACTDLECAPRLPKLLDLLEDKEIFYIVYEYIQGGDLFDRVRSMNGACVPETLAYQWMSDLLHCLTGFRRLGIAHMDLSPEVIYKAGKVPFYEFLLCIGSGTAKLMSISLLFF